MLVTFREHAAPDLCIFHTAVTIPAERPALGGQGCRFAASGLFTAQYELLAARWYLKC
jgi:hypothetical protein